MRRALNVGLTEQFPLGSGMALEASEQRRGCLGKNVPVVQHKAKWKRRSLEQKENVQSVRTLQLCAQGLECVGRDEDRRGDV